MSFVFCKANIHGRLEEQLNMLDTYYLEISRIEENRNIAQPTICLTALSIRT